MHKYFYKTYLLILPSSLVTSPLTDIVICLRFLLFYGLLATSLSSIMQIILVSQIFFFFTVVPYHLALLYFLPAPRIYTSLSNPLTMLSSHSPYSKSSICPLSRLFSLCHRRGSISLFFPLFPCHLANKSLSDLSVNMPDWEDE